MRKKYRLEEYEGLIDTSKEYISDCLYVDEATMKRIHADISAQMNSSEKVTVSEILSNVLDKYWGKELVYALFYLGYRLALMYKNGILIPSTKWREREGEV